MTNTDMVVACAEMMGIPVSVPGDGPQDDGGVINHEDGDTYNPLVNDGQLMAIIKRFPVECLIPIHSYSRAVAVGAGFNLNLQIVHELATAYVKNQSEKTQ